MEFRRLIVIAAAAMLATAGLGACTRPARAALLPVQRLQRDPGPAEKLESAHFSITYNPRRMSASAAEAARAQAEAAWDHCRDRFGSEPAGKIHLELTPRFVGATGFASFERPRERGEKPRPLVGVRYTELEYLGLAPQYVLTHEVGHVFSGNLAATTLGEGIADWAAGNFSGIPMRPWWARALRDRGLWVEPTAFFITGEFDQTPEVDANIRTAQYAESALLVQYLVDRFGWAKFREFAAEYSRARGPLESNASRRSHREERTADEATSAPEAGQVRAVFQRHFGLSWEALARDWEEAIRKDPAPAGMAERLVLGEKLYGAVRNWEMWTLRSGGDLGAGVWETVRAAFTEANRALSAGNVEDAGRLYGRARALVERLKHPKSVA